MPVILTEDQKLMRETVREFCEKEVRPRAVEVDRSEEFPFDLWKRCGELGFCGMSIPEEYGGTDTGAVAEQIVMEEIAKELPVLALALDANMLSVRTLLACESDELRKKYLPGMATGELMAAYGITEPAGSSNYLEWPNIGVTEGEETVLNGTKNFVTGSHISDFYCILGLIDGALGVAVVDKGTPGLETGHIENKLGMNGSYSGTVTLNNVRVPKTNVLRSVSNPDTPLAYVNISAISLGIMEAVVAKTKDYLMQRTRFKLPLAGFQRVAHNLAEMETKIEFARSMIFGTAQLFDAGEKVEQYTHMVKAMVPTWTVEIVTKCLEMHGGIGYSEDTGIARYLRDSICNLIGEFPTDQHWDQVALGMGLPIQTSIQVS